MPVATVNGVRIHYETHGHGRPIVLAHGYTASLRLWDGQIEPLSRRYRVVVYDTRGHGGSEAPADMNAYSIATFAEDQAALMDHLGIDRAIVGGLSMGGVVAQEFALRYPERVEALLLCDTGAMPPGTFGNPEMRERMAAMQEEMARVARERGMAAIAEWMRQNPQGPRPEGPIPEGVRRHLEGVARMSVDGWLGGWHALQTWPGATERLQEITAPTLVIIAELDSLRPAGEIIHQRIPGSRQALITGSFHGSCLWKTEAFNRALLDFLDDLEAGNELPGEVVY
ncbi:MAG TPA: alpha/beta fold hydrolase [Dehalococcoidia bacterium]|nr:alpha/beta fold hydrolase [Dehalococcoidia bacterium]